MLRGRFAAAEQVSSRESVEKFDRGTDEKKIGYAVDSEPEMGLEHGHLQDLEVDMGEVIKDPNVEDYDLNHSPYPEV